MESIIGLIQLIALFVILPAFLGCCWFLATNRPDKVQNVSFHGEHAEHPRDHCTIHNHSFIYSCPDCDKMINDYCKVVS